MDRHFCAGNDSDIRLLALILAMLNEQGVEAIRSSDLAIKACLKGLTFYSSKIRGLESRGAIWRKPFNRKEKLIGITLTGRQCLYCRGYRIEVPVPPLGEAVVMRSCPKV